MSRSEAKETQPVFSETSFFTESRVKFLATHRFWIVAAVWLATRAYIIWGLTPDEVVASYFQMAGDWLDGFTPYLAFKVEYPPGALLLFVLPRIFTESPVAYGYAFAFVMLLADIGILLLLVRIAARIPREVVSDPVRRDQSVRLCLIYILFSAFFGHLMFQRYDMIMALLLMAVIHSALGNKRVMVDVLLALGIWFNLTVLAWIPVLWWYGWVSRDEPLSSKKYRKISDFSRALLPRAAVLAGGLGVLFLPFILLAGRSLGYIVRFHLERGIQLESTAAGILLVGAKILGVEIAAGSTSQTVYLTGAAGSWSAGVSGIITIIVFVVLTTYLVQMMRQQSDAAARGLWLIRGLAATILALLATAREFLPQSLLWIGPLAAFFAHADCRRLSAGGWRLFAVNLLTLVLFFFYYSELVKLQLLPGILLLLRNGLVIWVVIALLAPETPGTDERRASASHPPGHIRNYLNHVPLLLLFAWGTIAAFCPVSSNDLWLLLREAADILANGAVAQVEPYSAVAFGRPYLAHEWLSGLVFLGIFKLGGGEALTVFRASAMLAMLLLLWYSLAKEDRGFMLAAPLLALAAYTILIRVFVRPHIFTLLFLCVWVFALEHWRRERRLRCLLPLVVLQVLWANLHGGYIFAPVLAAVMTGATAVLVLRPGWSTDERYAWPDVGTFAALTVACLAVSLINPNGFRLLEFSLTIGLASDYIKEVVFEWAGPLGARYAGSYGREAAIGMFVLIWVGLALNMKRRPFPDAVIALLATVMSAQAVRFLSFIGILGFPIAVRAWRAVADRQVNRLPVKRRPLIEAALFGLLLASTLIYGFPYGENKHRNVGWGLGGRMPYEETEFISGQGLEGAIFNDYGDGAFLIYHLYPKVRPVMDSRIDVYGRQLYREYSFSRENPVKFFQYLNKYKVSLILLRKSEQNLQINQYLNYLAATKLLLETDKRYLYSYDPKLLPPELLQQISP